MDTENEKRKQTVQRTYNSKCKHTDSARTIPINSAQVYMESRLLHETETMTQDNTHNKIQTHTRTHQKYWSILEECLQIFNDNVASGLLLICTCCLQGEGERLFQVCHVSYKSYNDTEWICHTCRTAIHECRIPKLSIYNKLGFPPQPPELYGNTGTLHQP